MQTSIRMVSVKAPYGINRGNSVFFKFRILGCRGESGSLALSSPSTGGLAILAASFLWPFFTLLLRFFHGQPLFQYEGWATAADGAVQLKIYWQFPGFYVLVTAGLLLLIRAGRRAK